MTLLVKFGPDRQTKLVFPAGAREVQDALGMEIVEHYLLREFPVSTEHKLGDYFERCITPTGPGQVYAYIINRKPEFKHKFYGWALPR